ncbi:MAG: hypothetical protein IH944_01695 [Armatimonadetes bacterium]|nr:hypothetical protein [Armatimonadota bacterium]
MGKQLGWFVVGVLSGMALMGAIARLRSEQDQQDVEELAESIKEKLEALEQELG